MTQQPNLPISMFAAWLASGERGISSEAIVSHLTGVPVGSWRNGRDYPHDPSDFRRCRLLLDAVPLAKVSLPLLASRSPQWARLVGAWGEIEATLDTEIRDRSDGMAPRTYTLMGRLIDDGTACAACDGTGRADACPKCKGTGKRGGGRCRNLGCFAGHFSCDACRGRGYTTERAA